MESATTNLLMILNRDIFVAARLRKMTVAWVPPKTVLLVDKQPKEIEYLTKGLAMAGFVVTVTRTGAGAIKSVKEHACDVVLLDIDLSDMDGIDVVKAIRETRRDLKHPLLRSVPFRT
jgi:CheY-like chemotaxis protein